MEEGCLTAFPSIKDKCEEIPFCKMRPGPISSSQEVWQTEMGLPRDIVQASPREALREIWTLHLFGMKKKGKREEVGNFSASKF
jgi:hypothetical protein